MSHPLDSPLATPDPRPDSDDVHLAWRVTFDRHDDLAPPAGVTTW